MTMQVAMVGTDGIVIASDRKVWRDSRPTTDEIGSVVDPPVLECKIEFSCEKAIAISCSGDLDAARKVAKAIIEELEETARADEYSAAYAMQAIADRVLADGDRSSIRCLIALKCPEWRLFTCTFASKDGDYGGDCEPHFGGWDLAGHLTNPAVFLARCHSEDQPVDELIPLASYLVLCAHFYNSERIEDLDVVRCDAQGVRRLSGSAIQELKRQKWDDSIRNLFATYRQKYVYRP